MALEDIDLTGKEPISITDDITGKDNSNSSEESTVNTNETNTNTETNNQPESQETDNSSSTGDASLEVGTQIEYDGNQYTISENGDIVDKDGNIFKEAKDVEAWLKENNVDENESSNDGSDLINKVQDVIGVSVVDEDGNPIEFTNDAEGISSYVTNVINMASDDIRQATINKLYADNPMLKQFLDYVQITGSPKGFGDIPDRTGIKLDPENENQQIAIIRMAASEFGNPTLNENYINYLKEAGGLADEAQRQLNALAEKDKQVQKNIAEKAEAQRKEQEEQLNAYWNNVYDIIDKRQFDGYKIPESFTKEINGKKMVYTVDDFERYISQQSIDDGNGTLMTAYQRDLANVPYETALQKDILNAWLMFTGSTYKDLINLAMKEDKVKQLKIKAAETKANKSIKVVRKPTKATINDIVLG